MENFLASLDDNARKVNSVLETLLYESEGPENRVNEAMRYATLQGGKRVRPFLVLQSSGLFGVDEDSALRVAAAVEMVHAYSLVHDDLPAMDDDDMRRGQPTCHIQFDEATAILAGDALLTRAFEVLSDPATHNDAVVRSNLVLHLAQAAGAQGMVGGQMFDLVAGDHDLDMSEVTRLQQLKTGRLIAFSCEAGAILGKASEKAQHALHAYAHDVGLAFQIADDLLDHEGDEEVVGKKTGKDEEMGKSTFITLLGPARAKDQAHMLADQAIAHLDMFADQADALRDFARFVVTRKN